jgi:glycosyltransferase involved in cell wall biosynthesis
VLGRLARLVRGQRYGIWSMDLHPDAEIASGMLRDRAFLTRILVMLHRFGLRGADFVVDLGAYMKRRLEAHGVDPARTATVHVWSDRSEVAPIERGENPLLDELGLRDRFVVMYSGNAGIVHDFDAILEAMRRLKDDERIFFLFVGGGPQRAAIERYAAEHEITNFSYRGYVPRDRLRFSLAAGDAHLISLRAPFVGISVPGKLYGIMAAGRPALFVGPAGCESADAVRDNACGVVISSDSADPASLLVATLREWSERPELASALGARGRSAFIAQYERVPNCESFAALIAERWGSPAATGTRPVPGSPAATAGLERVG